MNGSTWIMAFGVAGTWAIAIAAIWGERIRSSLFKPQLEIGLLKPAGELQTENVVGAQRTRLARYYHIRVRNLRRFPAAHEVRVVILNVEAPGPRGLPQSTFAAGALPLRWRYQQFNPITQTVGSECDADFFAVSEDKDLYFLPLYVPNNFPAIHQGVTRLWVTLVARAIEIDSKPLRLEIAWDGQWEKGEAEILKHLTVTVA